MFRRRKRAPKGATEVIGQAESVEECLKIVEAISDEARATGRHLDLKTGQIAGFAAVALTLNATLGRPLLEEDLSLVWELVAHASFFVAVAALLVSAAAALFGVIAPKQQLDLSRRFIRELAAEPAMRTDPQELRERWLATLSAIAVSDRQANRNRVRAMRTSLVFLAVGLLGVAGQALTLGVTA